MLNTYARAPPARRHAHRLSTRTGTRARDARAQMHLRGSRHASTPLRVSRHTTTQASGHTNMESLQGSRAPVSSRLGLAFDFSRWCRAGTVSVWSSGVWVLLARGLVLGGAVESPPACRLTAEGHTPRKPATLLYKTVVGQTEGGRTRERRVQTGCGPALSSLPPSENRTIFFGR